MYVNSSLSNRDRMCDAYADDMLIEPRGTPFTQDWIPDEMTYQACPYSEYWDYWFWRRGRLMDDYGADGLFLDGRMYASCANSRHGCGAQDAEGRAVARRDIWEAWRNQWRMYNLVHSRGGYSDQHKSSQWDAPMCFLWDCVWEGEQLMGTKRDRRRRLDVMPQLIMRAQDEFGANLGSFVGFWSARPPAAETPHDLVKVSAHVANGRALVMVADFDEDHDRVDGEVRLSLQNLGLMAPRVRDGSRASLRN